MIFSCGNKDKIKKLEDRIAKLENKKEGNLDKEIAIEMIDKRNKLIDVNVQAGEKGIIFYTLGDGLDAETTYGQGINFYLPWNKMIVYEEKDYEYRPNMYRSPTLETYGNHNIEDSQEISKSTKSKVIVIGNGDGDLPIILGGE
tara:strand:+ start:683 stop:1114 length:432 start_codon:yes stop_codon:yes gene_type:complete